MFEGFYCSSGRYVMGCGGRLRRQEAPGKHERCHGVDWPHFCHRLFLKCIHIRWVFLRTGANRRTVTFGVWLHSLQNTEMRRICCFRWASKGLNVFSFRGLRPSAPEPRWGLYLRRLVTGSRSALVTCVHRCLDYSYHRLFVPWTVCTLDLSYHLYNLLLHLCFSVHWFL